MPTKPEAIPVPKTAKLNLVDLGNDVIGFIPRAIIIESSARIAFSNPLKSPLTRSVTSTTSSWFNSSWKPAAKLVIHEIPRTFKPE